jgi:phosphoglucosamine mutase
MNEKRTYFGTDGIRGRVGEYPITPDFILKLGNAFGRVIRKQGFRKVLIGKDTRISGYMFEAALEAGLVAAGADIYLVGPMPTPAIAYLTRTLRAGAGIVISASHNPFYDNGIKFFSSMGTKLPDEMEKEIEAYLAKPMEVVDAAYLGKATRLTDAPARYIEFCKNTLSQHTTLDGITMVVDCANGATCRVAPYIFRELGAKVIELSTDPDGLNINDHCGSTHMESVQRAVLTHEADLGVAFDGDGDRVLMVDGQGEIVDGDEILYIIAKTLLAENRFKGGVAGTLMTNFGLETALTQLNVPFERSAVGDRYVLELLVKNGWLLGGEASGHITCLDVSSTGDGIIAALRVLASIASQGKSLHELKKGMFKYPQVLINVLCKQTDQLLTLNPVQKSIQGAEQKLAKKGRVLVRLSGTEPLVRVMVEGEDAQMVNELAHDVAQVIEKEAQKSL